MTVDLENILNEDDEKKNEKRKNKGKSIEREKKPRTAAQIAAFEKMVATKKEKHAAKKKAIEDAKQAAPEEVAPEEKAKPFPKPSNFNPMDALSKKPKVSKAVSEPLKEIEDEEEEAYEESEEEEVEEVVVKPKKAKKPPKKAAKKPAPKKKKKVIIEESETESDDDIDLSNWLGDEESSEDEYEQVYIKKKKPSKKIVKQKSIRQAVAQPAQVAQPQQEDPLEKLHWRERARLRGF